MTEFQSSRSDGLGHWPAGKRRHTETDEWIETRRVLNHLIDHHWLRGSISNSALAGDLGVRDNAVRKWRDGRAVPHPDTQLAVREWVAARLTNLDP